MISWTKKHLKLVRSRLSVTNLDNIFWLLNIIPNLLGFSVRQDTISGIFWYIHLSLLFYIYGVGSAAYQVNHAKKAEDYIKSNVNVALMILISNMSWWWMKKRPILRAVLKEIEKTDGIAGKASEKLKHEHIRLLRRIKNIILVFNISQLLDALLMYIPHRVDVKNSYAMGMVSCVGLDAIAGPAKKEVCMIIIVAQEFSLIITALHYQTMLIFLIAHTAGMFHMLTSEMMDLNNYRNIKDHKIEVRKRLPNLVRRHTLTLHVFENLKQLYSVAIGVDFGSNTICICLLLFVSSQELIKFIALLMYCLLAFFLYCFLCQRMTNASEIFESAVYSCGWENFDLREQKMVYIMLLQAQKPVVMLAGDNVPVNMYTFASTLQFMYKFITVVKY